MNKSGNTPGRQPRPKKLLKSEIDNVQPPEWMSPYAVKAFTELKPLVADRATLSDMPMFFALAVAYGKMMEAEESIRDKGLQVVDAKGCIVKNPLWSVQKEAAQLMNALSVKFSLSPCDRARLSNEQAAQDANDPIAALLLKANKQQNQRS